MTGLAMAARTDPDAFDGTAPVLYELSLDMIGMCGYIV